jgi:hypothetical protein
MCQSRIKIKQEKLRIGMIGYNSLGQEWARNKNGYKAQFLFGNSKSISLMGADSQGLSEVKFQA